MSCPLYELSVYELSTEYELSNMSCPNMSCPYMSCPEPYLQNKNKVLSRQRTTRAKKLEQYGEKNRDWYVFHTRLCHYQIRRFGK